MVIRPRYTEVYRNIQRYNRGIQRYTEVCRDIQRYTEIHRGMQRCRDIQKYTEIYRDMYITLLYVTYCDVIEFSLQLMNLSQQVRSVQAYTNKRYTQY